MKYPKQTISSWIQDLESMIEKVKANPKIMSNPGNYEAFEVIMNQRGMAVSVYTGRDTTYLISDDESEEPIILI